MRANDAPQHDEPDNALVSRLLSRRRVLALSGAAGAVVLGGAGAAAGRGAANSSTLDSVKAAASASSVCMPLTTEQIEGPYYIDYELFRGNVVEDRTGIPLLLVLRAVDSATCKPIRNSAVEIWHCDASGVYSGYTQNGNGGGGGGTPPSSMPSGPPPTDAPTAPPGGPDGGGGGHATPTDNLTWLRGIQMTDHEGFVVFRTVFPGWYAGRAVHIHTKVHTGGSRTSDGYTGGRTCHTGQFYFSEDSVKATADSAPYSANTMTRMTLDQDFLYPGTGAQGGLLELLYDSRHIEHGVIGYITMAVDPNATNDGAGAPGPVPTAPPSSSAS
ncbi:intradiol ring-cleavage dioxygenase [Streptomyces hydrogenans]|uniref:Protocatechuate dioxygenase n=2 Tax=Streptomyces hydrogenans TaxID=1873719 RepID=A0ABQ3PL87_9ACTN|nr:intradiol ring-cleavage dioxygenase [Streptomyces hydrogenans]GHE31102.1 protocatechuate dioxygenase [Streptomyces hydrogenans]GHI20294.1 protocatechuate dioxygenase [Streptomyces hydrogenans]GHI20328.1 protocatechuate dioxygenase [Streptomyces hydrogenans]GHI22884.1 protocatechuate dioxygenase [Streptomyces hydrogenans]GHI24666.1 protocatechuate dioxygenase [Streptomyces hydrogenans]